MKHHIEVSYDIKNPDSFSILDNKRVKTSPKTNDISSNTTTTAVYLSNKEFIILFSFSHSEFLKILENKHIYLK